MTNIPKKLAGIDYGEITIADIVITLNELIDYLQANKPVGCCCIKKHSTGEVSKKDKYLCYTCNQWGIVGEHECEASKGECKHSWDTSGGICQLCGITYRESREELRPNPPDAWGITVPVNLPEHSGDIAWCECECHTKGSPQPKCDKCYPPEHEEDFDRLAEGLRNHVIDDVRFSGLFEYVKDYIRDNFEPKRKKHE